MRKIPTLFDRDYESKGKHYVINERLVELPEGAIATEKLDGMNVRVTVRGGVCQRLEKRRNPNRWQKAEGIVDPWYVDAVEDDPADKYLYEALDNTSFLNTDDGEWSGEALGPKIQGNPLGRGKHFIYLFSDPRMREGLELNDIESTTFHDLRVFLLKRRSILSPEVGIEGIVWWHDGSPVGKIKAGDFQ